MSSGWTLLAAPVLIGLNAFFVAGEYAVVAVRATQIQVLRRRGYHRSAKAIEALKLDTTSAIGTIQVCITLMNLVLGWISEPAMTSVLQAVLGPLFQLLPQGLSRPVSISLSFILVTLLTVLLSELLPKTLTLRYVPMAVVLTAIPVQGIQWVLRPVVWSMNQLGNLITRPLGLGRVDERDLEHVTTEELRLLTTEAARDGILTTRERAMILNTLALGRRTARQIMVPRVHVTYMDLQKSMDENRAIMGRRLFSRLPLCEGGLDRVVGVVSTKEFLSAYHAAGDTSVLSLIARAAVFMPEIASMDQLLEAFHDQHTQMVFLVDEYGGVAGLVTLRDVLDELLGVVADSRIMTAAGLQGELIAGDLSQPFAVAGDLPLHELAQRLGREEWSLGEQAASVGGLLQSRLGYVPAAGECVEVDGVRLRVLKSDMRAVRQVEIQALPAPPRPRP